MANKLNIMNRLFNILKSPLMRGYAQGIFNRFYTEEDLSMVFQEKGCLWWPFFWEF